MPQARVPCAALWALALAASATGQGGAPNHEGIADDADIEFVMPRPDADGVPTRVSLGLYVIDVTELNDVAQSFSADFLLRATWRDPRLAGGEEAIRVFDLDEIWDPGLLVANQRRLFKTFKDGVRVDRDGNCMFRQRYYGDLSAHFDLRDFPLDSQTIAIGIVATADPAGEIDLVLDGRMTGRNADFSEADVAIGDGAARVDSFYFAPADATMARLVYAFEMDRHGSYYFWKVLLPLAIIVFMSWSVFWIDPENVGPQLSVSVTSVLTLIAYRFMLGNLLPRVSYLTRLDLYILGATIIVFLSLIVTVTTSNLANHGNPALSRRIDRVSRIVFPALFALIVLYSFVLPR